jgi:secondary thiamine-phosphate synthase enzyme
MRQANTSLVVATRGEGLVEFTPQVRQFVTESGILEGLLTLFCRHTSASLLVQENADPDVRADLLDFFRRLAPVAADYRHDSEGPDNMPAHVVGE